MALSDFMCCAVPLNVAAPHATDTCLQAVGYLALKQQLSMQLLDGDISSSNTNTPTMKQSAAQPAHSDSSCNGTVSKGGTLKVPALSLNSPGPAGSTSDTLIAKAMEPLLQSMPLDQAEFWRLALLRQPRQPSAIQQLQLQGSLPRDQLAALQVQHVRGCCLAAVLALYRHQPEAALPAAVAISAFRQQAQQAAVTGGQL
jgi:hypothetical protein